MSHQVDCKNAGEQEINQCHSRLLVSGEQPSEKIHAMEQCCHVGEKCSHQESHNQKGEQQRKTAWHKSSNKDKKENRVFKKQYIRCEHSINQNTYRDVNLHEKLTN